MTVRDDDSDDGGFVDGTFRWSGDERPLDHLLEFIAPGSRLVYEYQSTARIGGALGFLEIAPVVGVVRYAEHHEYITGIHFISGGKKCLLDFDEFVGLLKLLEAWISPRECQSQENRPQVKSVHYETRSGLVIERVESRWGEFARVNVASPVTIMLTGSQFEQLFRECHSVKVFLDEFRG